MNKFRPSLSKSEFDELNRLSQIDFSNFSEADVREEYIVHLLVLLGYRKNQDYSVSREDSFQLNNVFLNVGSKNIRLDYLFSVRKQFFWLIDAKKGSGAREISEDAIYQAYFYSQHPQIDTIYFAVCNGWYFNLYERDQRENQIQPIVSITSNDLPSRFLELDSYLGATQILPTLKRELLKRTEKILSAEVALERLPEFLNKTKSVLSKIRPVVLNNFRENAKKVEASRKKEYDEYLRSLKPYDIVDSLFLTANTIGEMDKASDLILESEHFSNGHSNHVIFFDKLLLNEIRPVTYFYYINVMNFFLKAKAKGITNVDYTYKGEDKGSIDLMLYDWIYDIYTFYQLKPDIRLLSSFEGLNYRFLKFFLILSSHTRELVTDKVKYDQFYIPEEQIAWLGPNPAKELLDLVSNTTFSSIGMFLDKYYERNQRKMKYQLAKEHYNTLQRQYQKAYELHSDRYGILLKELGSSWSELLGFDSIYHYWNPVISATSELLLEEPIVMENMPDTIIKQIGYVNSITISNFTDKLCQKYNIECPIISDEDKNRGREDFYLVHGTND